MYDICHSDTEALLKTLRQLLTEEGLEEDSALFQQPEDRMAHWQDSALLLSQTCGYPLRTVLPDVQVVGTFHYQAAGCDHFHYSSHLVVRAVDAGKILADFRDKRVVCNSEDSQSGYHCLRTLVVPLHHNGRFFSQLLFSGSHQNSLAALTADQADIAAIDAVTWALVSQHQPERTAGLVSLGTTPLIPGLPMITSAQTSAQTLEKLRLVLKRLVTEPEWRHVCDALLIKGFSVTSREDYQPVSDNVARAASSGLLSL
jgi:ABC-type phosphate/phosphonate transport system substrate-binding protein